MTTKRWFFSEEAYKFVRHDRIACRAKKESRSRSKPCKFHHRAWHHCWETCFAPRVYIVSIEIYYNKLSEMCELRHEERKKKKKRVQSTNRLYWITQNYMLFPCVWKYRMPDWVPYGCKMMKHFLSSSWCISTYSSIHILFNREW